MRSKFLDSLPGIAGRVKAPGLEQVSLGQEFDLAVHPKISSSHQSFE